MLRKPSPVAGKREPVYAWGRPAPGVSLPPPPGAGGTGFGVPGQGADRAPSPRGRLPLEIALGGGPLERRCTFLPVCLFVFFNQGRERINYLATDQAAKNRRRPLLEPPKCNGGRAAGLRRFLLRGGGGGAAVGPSPPPRGDGGSPGGNAGTLGPEPGRRVGPLVVSGLGARGLGNLISG